MTVAELIEKLQAFDGEYPVRIDACLNTPKGQVFFSEEIDTVCRPGEIGRNARAVVLCNWDGPAVHLSDLTPIE